jgi:hypothetical protein
MLGKSPDFQALAGFSGGTELANSKDGIWLLASAASDLTLGGLS